MKQPMPQRAAKSRIVVLLVAATVVLAGCGSPAPATDAGAGPSAATSKARSTPAPGGTPAGATATSQATVSPAQQAADRFLIQVMYDKINNAFARDPNQGLRAVIASQYPDDREDVDLTRCARALVPGATSLPPHFDLSFTPHWDSMEPDPGYQVTTFSGRQIQPRGRIYATLVGIAGNGVRPGDHQRHEVVLDGQAYQFTSC